MDLKRRELRHEKYTSLDSRTEYQKENRETLMNIIQPKASVIADNDRDLLTKTQSLQNDHALGGEDYLSTCKVWPKLGSYWPLSSTDVIIGLGCCQVLKLDTSSSFSLFMVLTALVLELTASSTNKANVISKSQVVNGYSINEDWAVTNIHFGRPLYSEEFTYLSIEKYCAGPALLLPDHCNNIDNTITTGSSEKLAYAAYAEKGIQPSRPSPTQMLMGAA
ncbi:hypothetical protein DPMN_189040 [Dreissena polymorpha]|uniref:Uncharacterized protein n=1 Tax=Dreissena polymorpha TaxID=45954 RepID=A0A9D4DUR2_DREPO|nr:hypothetical protein DPMN_189040 [Dreissena polymorpha]